MKLFNNSKLFVRTTRLTASIILAAGDNVNSSDNNSNILLRE